MNAVVQSHFLAGWDWAAAHDLEANRYDASEAKERMLAGGLALSLWCDGVDARRRLEYRQDRRELQARRPDPAAKRRVRQFWSGH